MKNFITKLLLTSVILVVGSLPAISAQDEFPPGIVPDLETRVNLDALIDVLRDLENALDDSVEISSSSFSANHTTVTLSGSGKWHGAFYSTGSVFDYVDIWDATATLVLSNHTPTRIYNDRVISTATVSTLGQGFSGPAKPIKYKNGLIWKPNVATFNNIHLLHKPD
jgi:hypothetical protein